MTFYYKETNGGRSLHIILLNISPKLLIIIIVICYDKQYFSTTYTTLYYLL